MIVEAIEPEIDLPDHSHMRPKGLHQSAIIRCIAKEHGLLKMDRLEELSLIDFNLVTDRVALLRMSVGLAWEEYYIPRIPNVIKHPSSILYDDVYMSLDGESLSVIFSLYESKRKAAIVVHEVKCTWKSTNTVGLLDTVERLRKNWIWLAQLKAYCIAKKTRFAWLHVLFVCGDYKFPITPQLWVFKIEFTEEELVENWTFLKDYANLKLREGF